MLEYHSANTYVDTEVGGLQLPVSHLFDRLLFVNHEAKLRTSEGKDTSNITYTEAIAYIDRYCYLLLF